MSGRVLHFDPATHKVVDVLLPWFANGTLEGEELALVQQHVDQCERCQREVEWLRDLHAACAAAAEVPGQAFGISRLRRRLEEPRKAPGLADRMYAQWRRARPWSRAVMAAQLAAILVLGALVVTDDGRSPQYRTLGAAGSTVATGSLVVVFDPATTENDLRRMLRSVGARIVDGPTQANAYLLDIPAETRDQAVLTLKGDRRVVLVEPLGGGASR